MKPKSAATRNFYVENRKVKKVIEIHNIDDVDMDKELREEANKAYKKFVVPVLDKKKIKGNKKNYI